MRVSVLPIVERPCVEVRVEVPLDAWAHACRLMKIDSLPSRAQLLAATRVCLTPGISSLSAMMLSLRKGEDLAKEVLSWKELDAVPLGRLVRAIIAAGAVLEGE